MLKQILTRKRTWGVWGLSALVLGVLFYTDPDRGGTTRDMLVGAVAVGLAFTGAHFLRKFLFDYIKLSEHVKSALNGNVGAGLVVHAVILFILGAAWIFSTRVYAQEVISYVPVGAYKYCPILQSEKDKLWPMHSQPAALCSLVEQESCITLKHSKCWSPLAQLKTSREEGSGFGQITRAYRQDGSIRFDALEATKKLDPSLAEWNWSNVYKRPDLQLRSIVVINRDCFSRLSRLVKNPHEVYRMCDAAYNGGYAGMQSERRACGMRSGCNPQVWEGNVENVCLKSKVKWKGYGKSACEINREHVDMVFNVRYQKYLKFTQAKT